MTRNKAITCNHFISIKVKIGKSLLPTIDVLPTHVELLSRDLRTGNDVKLAESDLIQRDFRKCANQYISSLMNVPVKQYKNSQTPLFVKIIGREGKTDNFQRIQLYFPMPIKCQNGAVYDEYGYCNCPKTYTGDDCTIPRCQVGLFNNLLYFNQITSYILLE